MTYVSCYYHAFSGKQKVRNEKKINLQIMIGYMPNWLAENDIFANILFLAAYNDVTMTLQHCTTPEMTIVPYLHLY